MPAANLTRRVIYDTNDLRTSLREALEQLDRSEADRDKLERAMEKALSMLEVDDGSNKDALNDTVDRVINVLRAALGGDR